MNINRSFSSESRPTFWFNNALIFLCYSLYKLTNLIVIMIKTKCELTQPHESHISVPSNLKPKAKDRTSLKFFGVQKNHTAVYYFTNKLTPEGPQSRTVYYSTAQALDKGGFATVYPASNFFYSSKLSVCYVYACKVTKVFDNVDSNKKRLIENEYELSNRAGHLGIKRPVYVNNSTRCHLIMNLLPGKSLFDVLNEQAFGQLETGKKLALSYQLLKKLLEQVTNHNIVHRDIKPDNIMVELEPLTVNIIDYGFSKDIAMPCNDFPGSLVYSAPEMFQRLPHDYSCDVYSIGKVISLLWATDLRYYDPDNVSNYVLLSLDFGRMLPEIIRAPSPLVELLTKMLEPNPPARISLPDAIRYFAQHFHMPPLTTDSLTNSNAPTISNK